jgi:hypothetical protein
MLDAWIIDQIKRREREERENSHRRPQVQVELPHNREEESRQPDGGEESDRGVTIVDFTV